jgi:hypothetical protein
MSSTHQSPDLRFLYCPWRDDHTQLTVHRHLIVNSGPKWISIQLLSYDENSEEDRRYAPLIDVDRSLLEHYGCVSLWYFPEFGSDPDCPLGTVFVTELAARSILRSWAGTALGALINQALLN